LFVGLLGRLVREQQKRFYHGEHGGARRCTEK
jgi:hypothetical protein